MKKLLIISSIYPGPDVPQTYTPVVHYFTRQWVNMGIDVRVIHTSNYFPSIYYSLPNFIRNIFASRKGFALPEKRLNKEIDFELDCVKVHRVPMMKIIPGRAFSMKEMKKAKSCIESYLEDNNFCPDYIIAHWIIPQAELLFKLKKKYNCPTALVLHDDGSPFKFCKNYERLIESIDIWGYRSEQIKAGFESIYGKRTYSFRCYSGIPSSFLDNVKFRNWQEVCKFVYVGMLIERKHPDKVITAVKSVFDKEDFSIDIIGEGGMSIELDVLARKHKCRDKVNLLGRIDRAQIKDKLDSSDVFIMISEKEVFGLVYLEAMARGCIVIASRDEGMQGIIIDGINGFLCKAGDAEELSVIIRRIKDLPTDELSRISKEAQKTARKFTDYEVAKDYYDNIVQLGAMCKQHGNNVNKKDSSTSLGGVINFLRKAKWSYYIHRYKLSNVSSTFIIGGKCSISKDFVAGEYSYVGPGASIYPNVKIGNYTMIANDVHILGGDHVYKKAGIPMIFAGRDKIKKTIIGSDVWIGAYSIIMAGVTIGDGAIVAAGSVVTKDIEPYSIVGGCPAKLIKMRFNDEKIKNHKRMLNRSVDENKQYFTHQILRGNE